MNIKGKCIRNLFEHSTYYLPKWQRRYEWDQTYWKNIWNSIIVAYSKGGTYYSDIFFGTMLFQQRKPGDIHYAIVDGQQRLLTISIVLSAIRDLSVNDINLQNLINNILLINPSKFRQNLPNEKIIPFLQDQHQYRFFINRLEEKPQKSTEVFSKCYDFFLDEIRKSGFELNHLFEAITRHFCVSTVIVDNNENAGELFYELNYGGMPLKDIDRVRVTFFADLDPSLYHLFYETYWVPVEKYYYEEPDLFVKYLEIVIGFQGFALSTNPLQEFVYQLREYDSIERQKRVHKFLEDMSQLWDPYLFLINPTKIDLKYCDEIKLRLIRLNLIDISYSIPLLLNWVVLCNILKNPTYEEKIRFIDLLKIIETFYVRNNICREQSTIASSFNKINQFIKPIDDLDEYYKEIKEVLSQSLPNDGSFLKELEISRIFKIKNGSISRLILFCHEKPGTLMYLFNIFLDQAP